MRSSHAGFVLVVCMVGCTGRPGSAPVTDNRPTFAVPARGDRPRYNGGIEIDEGSGLRWTGDIEMALMRASKHGKRVFVAFEGLIDVNCRLNRVNYFNQKPVREALGQYVLVSLHIDRVPDRFYVKEPPRGDGDADAEANAKFLQETFETITEPSYAVLDPVDSTHFKVVGFYEAGRIEDGARFVEFLKDPAKRPE